MKFKDLADLNRQHIYAGCCRLTRYRELQRLQLTEFRPNDEEPGSNQLFVKPVYRTEAKKGEGARVIGGHVIDGYVIEAHAIRAHVVLGHVVGGRVLRGSSTSPSSLCSWEGANDQWSHLLATQLYQMNLSCMRVG